MAAKLAETMHPAQIYLFGSYAWGKPTKDSDLDFCLVFDKVNKRQILPLIWTAHGALEVFDVSKDVIIRSTERMERCKPYRAPLESKILRQGKLLYDAAS